MPGSYYGGGPQQRCANATCRNTFVPNFYGRHKMYCSHRCAAIVSWRRRARGITAAAVKSWQEQRQAEREAWQQLQREQQ
jgi:hypothetical protein